MGSPAQVGRGTAIDRLAALVEAIEERGRAASPPEASRVATGWGSVDAAMDEGLPRGAVHEWFGLEDGDPETTPRRRAWSPPLFLLRHLAKRALEEGDERGRAWALWVGRRVWPYPRALAATSASDLFGDEGGPSDLLRRSVFVDPPDDGARLWAIDLVLRCSSIAVVVADARSLPMAASRRLQLAAEAGGALGLLARPPGEAVSLSAAATRWRVCRLADAASSAPRWRLDLLRRKPARGLFSSASSLPFPSAGTALEWDHAASAVVEPAGVVDRPGATAGEADGPALRPAV